MRLASRHRRGGVVEHGHDDVGAVVNRVYHARYARMKERRVPYEREIDRIGLDAVKPLRHSYAGAHAEAGVDHIERHGVA